MSKSTSQNRAAWLDEPNTPLQVRDAEMPVPLSDEVLIKVHAVAINPVDAGRQSPGFPGTQYPRIFGSDLAGIIESVGSDVTKFKGGDRVLALASEFTTQKSTNAAFQSYMTTYASKVCKIPSSMSFTDACTIPLGLSTAAGMAFESVTLACRLPKPSSQSTTSPANSSSSSTSSSNEVIILWGASSSVGTNALQLLKSASPAYRVIALASARNHALLTSLGADTCFDYTDPNLISKISDVVKERGWTSAGILGAAGFLPPGPESEVTRQKTGELALALGGRKFVSTPLARGLMEVPMMPEGVGASNVLASILEEPVDRTIWGEWLEKALASGQFKPSPPADVVGEGLEGIDGAIAVMRKGVSGKKIVCKLI